MLRTVSCCHFIHAQLKQLLILNFVLRLSIKRITFIGCKSIQLTLWSYFCLSYFDWFSKHKAEIRMEIHVGNWTVEQLFSICKSTSVLLKWRTFAINSRPSTSCGEQYTSSDMLWWVMTYASTANRRNRPHKKTRARQHHLGCGSSTQSRKFTGAQAGSRQGGCKQTYSWKSKIVTSAAAEGTVIC